MSLQKTLNVVHKWYCFYVLLFFFLFFFGSMRVLFFIHKSGRILLKNASYVFNRKNKVPAFWRFLLSFKKIYKKQQLK